MRKNSKAIDGFISRDGRREIGQAATTQSLGQFDHLARHVDQPPVAQSQAVAPSVTPLRSVSRSEVDDSLKDIDDEPNQPPKRRWFGRRRRNKSPLSRRRKIIKRAIIAIVVVLALVGAYVGIKAFIASSSVFQGNIFDIFQNKPLKTDANGRSNILIFGTSGSAEDSRHPGANLTDTVMVLSIDQKTKDAYMVSLPRDLYVDYGGACSAGYQGRINEIYNCVSREGQDQPAGARALQKKVSEVTGLTLQYYAHVNWAVVVAAVNAVGGVNVNVQGNGACPAPYTGGVVDANMKIAYAGGVHRMNGDQALRFSRARADVAPTCGLDAGDYDRQANQQKVILALKDKAVSAGTVTNVGKVTGLIDALGANLRSDFATSEIRTLLGLAQDIPTNKIKTISLNGDGRSLIGSQNIGGASVQVPTAGAYDYSAIRAYIKKQISSDAVSQEEAHVALFNGAGIEGYAGQQSTRLQELGFTITAADTAPAGNYSGVAIYDLSNGTKPATKARLESTYGVKVREGKGPITVTQDTDFVIIYGPTTSAN